MDLSKKTVLITGGAIRIGRAISKELSSAGANIFCHYHSSREDAVSLQKEIQSSGGEIHIHQCDLSASGVHEELISEVIRKFGRIDILINNSAVFYKTQFGKITEKDWDTFHNLNLKSAFFLAQAAGNEMLKQHSGKIINIGDAGALSPWPSYLPYSISKAGIIAMTIGLAKALAPYIQVNCVNPGPVMIPKEMPKAERQKALDQTLLKKEGSASDIAKTVRFLLEGSDYITGAVIPVDGGRQIR